jgi:hypothetical protein
MTKLKVIACDVLRREVSYLAACSKCYVDTLFLPQGLHEFPDKLHSMLAEEIEKANQPFDKTGTSRYFEHKEEYYDYIVLGYGLCDNAIVGLSSAHIPLAVPRGHDCMTLILGSRKRYQELFEQCGGTYWYTRGWIERALQPGKERYERTYKAYADKFGEDNAKYLMDMEQGWFTKYSRALFVDWPVLGNSDRYRQYTKECAKYLKWNFQEEEGSPALLENIINGVFNDDEVQVVPPGRAIAASYEGEIIKLK